MMMMAPPNPGKCGEFSQKDVFEMLVAIQSWKPDVETDVKNVISILEFFQPIDVEFRKPAKAFAQTIGLLTLVVLGSEFPERALPGELQWRKYLWYDETVPQKTTQEKMSELPGMDGSEFAHEQHLVLVEAVRWLQACMKNTAGKHVRFMNGCYVCLADREAHLCHHQRMLL